MKFPAADSAAMVDALGDDVTIPGNSLRGVFDAAGRVATLFSGEIVTTGPMLTLTEASAALITVNSTVITIGGVTYQATQKLPDGAGFVDLELTRDY